MFILFAQLISQPVLKDQVSPADVQIHSIKGKSIKNVIIREIDCTKGNIVYQKDGALHDFNIDNVAGIYACDNCKQVLYFDKQNNPKIKESERFDGWVLDFCEFKISPISNELVITNAKEAELTQQALLNDKQVEPKTEQVSLMHDTLVNASGIIIPVKIIHISENEIKYKRADLPQGPLYTINSNSKTQIIKHENCFKVIINKAN